jgi:hypothetical protein
MPEADIRQCRRGGSVPRSNRQIPPSVIIPDWSPPGILSKRPAARTARAPAAPLIMRQIRTVNHKMGILEILCRKSGTCRARAATEADYTSSSACTAGFRSPGAGSTGCFDFEKRFRFFANWLDFRSCSPHNRQNQVGSECTMTVRIDWAG